MPGLGDLDSYLARIGLHGRPDWPAIHRAHATSIPFENLDPATGTAVSLDVDRLEDKLVARRRGGYCFEHNLLLKAALKSVGIHDVTPMLARVRQGGNSRPRPRSHLILRVVVDGAAWHADVGFGGDTLLDPIPFGAGAEVEQSGWRYRTVEDGPEVVLQTWREGAWIDLYGFVPEPAEPIDIDVANWYTCTNPRSPFVSGIFVATQRPGIRLTLMAAHGEARLTERTPQTASVRQVGLDDIASTLAAAFGLEDVPIPAVRHPDQASLRL
ncbi:MAG: arylamine N-acetyltransferase family protein [Acidimicrobiales bacterium]